MADYASDSPEKGSGLGKIIGFEGKITPSKPIE